MERSLGGGKGIKPRGSVDSRQSIRSTVSVSKLADAIQRQNASLEHNLTKSNVARKRMEKEMYALREDFQRQMAETAKMQEDQKAEILDYVKTIVKNLERKS